MCSQVRLNARLGRVIADPTIQFVQKPQVSHPTTTAPSQPASTVQTKPTRRLARSVKRACNPIALPTTSPRVARAPTAPKRRTAATVSPTPRRCDRMTKENPVIATPRTKSSSKRANLQCAWEASHRRGRRPNVEVNRRAALTFANEKPMCRRVRLNEGLGVTCDLRCGVRASLRSFPGV